MMLRAPAFLRCATVGWLALSTGLAFAGRAAAAPLENLALGRPVLASSSVHDAALAVDYRTSTVWRAAEAGAGWVQVDLGEMRWVVGIEARFPDGRAPVLSVVEVSHDGAEWREVAAISGPAAESYRPYFGLARYVRWRVVDAGGRHAELADLWVFGAPAKPLPPIPQVDIDAPRAPTGEFVRGADVSHLLQNEHYGATYSDANGSPRDLLELLRDAGVNTIRIKVWNDPGNRTGEFGRLHDPLGFNNPEWATRLAVRAANLGFRIMIDFHYSDTWADPQKQFLPQAWTGRSMKDLEHAVYAFTYDTLTLLGRHGVEPEWVQVGNEIRNGMLWPHGRWNKPEEGGSWANLARFLRAGHAAVKAVNPKIKVVVHYDNAGHTAKTQDFYDAAAARGVEWDVTGLSYYPHWHGGYDDMEATVRNLAARYGKPVNLVEIAHPWTEENFDDTGNALTVPDGFPHPPTLDGQIAYLREIERRLKAVPDGRGEGMIYWQPEWTPIPGAGWAIGAGSGWENAALFDQNGRALPSLRALGGTE